MKSSTNTDDAKPKNESRVVGVLGNESESTVGCSKGWVTQVKQAVCKYGSFVGPGVMVSVAYIDPGNYATGVRGFLLATLGATNFANLPSSFRWQLAQALDTASSSLYCWQTYGSSSHFIEH